MLVHIITREEAIKRLLTRLCYDPKHENIFVVLENREAAKKFKTDAQESIDSYPKTGIGFEKQIINQQLKIGFYNKTVFFVYRPMEFNGASVGAIFFAHEIGDEKSKEFTSVIWPCITSSTTIHNFYNT
jgi:hypothetical protein